MYTLGLHSMSADLDNKMQWQKLGIPFTSSQYLSQDQKQGLKYIPYLAQDDLSASSIKI